MKIAVSHYVPFPEYPEANFWSFTIVLHLAKLIPKLSNIGMFL